MSSYLSHGPDSGLDALDRPTCPLGAYDPRFGTIVTRAKGSIHLVETADDSLGCSTRACRTAPKCPIVATPRRKIVEVSEDRRSAFLPSVFAAGRDIPDSIAWAAVRDGDCAGRWSFVPQKIADRIGVRVYALLSLFSILPR